MRRWTKFLLVVAVLLMSVLLILWGKNNWFSDQDFKLGLLTEGGVRIVSISKERKMINELIISPETMVWVPKGLGWYRSDRILKLLNQENKMNLATDLFFYNYGFVPDVVLSLKNGDNWENNLQFINKWGALNWLRFKWQEGQMRYKEETQKSDLDEVLPRDFSDNKIVAEDLKVSIYNASDSMGLASFVAKVLEWGGLTVVGVENYPNQVDNCRIVISKGEKTQVGVSYLVNQLKECIVDESTELPTGNVEIYFGEKFAQMLNYQSYKQAFQ